MRRAAATLFCVLLLTACRSAPTRQELIENAVTARAAADALDASQKALSDAAEALENATADLPDSPEKDEVMRAVKRTASALEKAEQAAEQAKEALAESQRLLAKESGARAKAEKERDENAVDARRWRITMWALMIAGPLALGFIVWRRFAK